MRPSARCSWTCRLSTGCARHGRSRCRGSCIPSSRSISRRIELTGNSGVSDLIGSKHLRFKAAVDGTGRKIASSSIPIVQVLPNTYTPIVGQPITYTRYLIGGAVDCCRPTWTAHQRAGITAVVASGRRGDVHGHAHDDGQRDGRLGAARGRLATGIALRPAGPVPRSDRPEHDGTRPEDRRGDRRDGVGAGDRHLVGLRCGLGLSLPGPAADRRWSVVVGRAAVADRTLGHAPAVVRALVSLPRAGRRQGRAHRCLGLRPHAAARDVADGSTKIQYGGAWSVVTDPTSPVASITDVDGRGCSRHGQHLRPRHRLDRRTRPHRRLGEGLRRRARDRAREPELDVRGAATRGLEPPLDDSGLAHRSGSWSRAQPGTRASPSTPSSSTSSPTA